MDYTPVSIKKTRDNLSELIERVALAKESFLVTKFGKPKALIISAESLKKKKNIRKKILKETAGLWARRKEIKGSALWVNKLREKESSRYGKIFS